MAVMGLLMPVAGLIKVRYGEKADIDSPFFKLHYRTTVLQNKHLQRIVSYVGHRSGVTQNIYYQYIKTEKSFCHLVISPLSHRTT